jgi:hypothetical protein
MYRMNTSIQIPLIDLPLGDEGEPIHDDTPEASSTRELVLGLLFGVAALVSVHVVWQVALLGVQALGWLP